MAILHMPDSTPAPKRLTRSRTDRVLASVYETAGYATAQKKSDISIDAGASSVAFHWK